MPAKATITWDMKCMYQHPFRYASANVGSKNQPCRNVPLKCELCHPILPLAPGKATRKTAVVPVGAIWHYNMHEHIFREHEEYMVPGQRDVGLALPCDKKLPNKAKLINQSHGHGRRRRYPSYHSNSHTTWPNLRGGKIITPSNIEIQKLVW
ncbi:hypothetical protein EDD22DRAFT_846226 [Suillus occidentalis]|nr:hypothetical protein EDD22DRAFT_846226 [Suillus occidentalis]